MKKMWIRRLIAAAVCALMLVPAQAEEAPALIEPAGVKLSSTLARVDDITTLSAYTGEVIPYFEALDFEIDGEIDQVYVVVGQQVKAGDVLITLDQQAEVLRRGSIEEEIEALETDIRYAEALAQVDLDILELELDRLSSRLPRDEKAISLKQLEIESFRLDRELSMELSLLELDRLYEELALLKDEAVKAVLTAPFDGRVMFIKDMYPGMRISAYSPLLYLADDTKLFIESDYITETTLNRANDVYALVNGQRVEVAPQPADPAEILSKAVSGEKLTTRFDILPGAELSAGQYAAVCIEMVSAEDVLVVPANALFAGASGRYVYVVENDTRTRRTVKTGAANSWYVQILEGLEEGEEVYVPD